MPPTLLAGAVLDRMPGPKYTSELRFAELALRAPLPRPATLKRMRHEAPPELVLALRAPQSTLCSARGPLRFDEALEAAFEWLLAARAALGARLTVLPTPADLTPGARDRQLLEQLARRLPREPDRHWVWAPSGAWEPEEAERLAESLGLVLGFDPLFQPKPKGAVAYARLRALGARRSFSEALLGEVAALMLEEGADQSYVAIDAARGYDYALRLQKLADAGSDAA